MKQLRFSLYEHTNVIDDSAALAQSNFVAPSHNAIWIAPTKEELSQGLVGSGNAYYLAHEDLTIKLRTLQNVLRFEVVIDQGEPHRHAGCKLLSSSIFSWPDHEAILRFDQVTFPSEAVAFRHIHSGAGFRYLTMGGLEIDAGDHQEHMRPGSMWFEGIDSPVTATAISGATSQFIRCMIIPVEFEGKPTIKILNNEDAIKPTLQKNHRFFDQKVIF